MGKFDKKSILFTILLENKKYMLFKRPVLWAIKRKLDLELIAPKNHFIQKSKIDLKQQIQ